MEPFALLLGLLFFCNIEGDSKHSREHALLVTVDPALGVDPPDVAGRPDDAELQLVRRTSGDGGVQRAAHAPAVVRVDPLEELLVREVELARRVAVDLGHRTRAPSLVGQHIPIQQAYAPGLGCQPQLLLGLAQLLLVPAAVDELADPAADEPDGIVQFLIPVQDLAAQELDDPARAATAR